MIKKRENKKGFNPARLAALLLFTLLYLGAANTARASDLKVIVLPFDTHSAQDIRAEKRSIMNSVAASLERAGAGITGMDKIKELVLEKKQTGFDESTALEVAAGVNADFAVLGSITRLGGTTSVDIRVLDIKARETLALYYHTSVSIADLKRKIAANGPVMLKRMKMAVMARPALRSGTIDRIEVAGNIRIDTEAIKQKISSSAGSEYSADDVKDDILSIYSTGYFDDVSADLSDTASGKVLTFTVSELPYIRKIELRGNTEIEEATLREMLTLKENTALDRVLLGENRDILKSYYGEQGYYLANINTEVKSNGVETTVIFNIQEGAEVRVRRVTFIGNKAISDKKLKKIISTKEAWLLSTFSESDRFDELMFQRDLNLIMAEYYNNGFIKADITDSRVLLSEDKKWFYITIAIDEGPQFSVGEVDVSGDLITTKHELLDIIKIEPGTVFNRSKLSVDIDKLSDFYGDKGYAYAEVSPRTKINEAERTININFELAKHELVYVERISISGNTRTRDKVIRRELETDEGNLYSTSEVKRSRNNLRRLGYFDSVKIGRSQGSAEDKINLDVEIAERPTGSISIGMGYSSVDKLIGTASISQDNFLGTGIKLNMSGTISSSSSRYVLSLTEPWLFDKPISAGIDIYNTVKVFQDFTIDKKGFGLRAGFPLYKRYTRGFLNYKFENVDVSEIADNASNFIKEQRGINTESSVKVAIRHDTRNDAFFPSEGVVANFSTELAGGPLGGTTYFVKYEAGLVKFFSLPLNTTFSLRGSLGYVQGHSEKDPPVYARYFLGGMSSIRGFKTRTISPKDEVTGDLIGGTTKMVANAEFVFPLLEEQKIKGVLFFDAGNAYNGQIDLGDIRMGAGGGIRWFSPMGPLRLELGINLDPRTGEATQQWDFTIGTLF